MPRSERSSYGHLWVMCEWMICSFQTDGGEGQRAWHEHPGSLLSWESCMWSLGCVTGYGEGETGRGRLWRTLYFAKLQKRVQIAPEGYIVIEYYNQVTF